MQLLKGGVFGGIVLALLSGCAVKQDITRLEDSYRPKRVCIVENDKVFAEVLDVIQQGVASHGLVTRVVKGTYESKHSMWQPKFNRADVTDCDALLFYVANWNWDLAYYMYFANIWMTSADGSKRIAQATYDASHNLGLGKFIVAKTKVSELVDQMLVAIPAAQGDRAASSPLPVPATPSLIPASHSADARTRLERLEDLHKRGLISDAEYGKKRSAILNEL